MAQVEIQTDGGDQYWGCTHNGESIGRVSVNTEKGVSYAALRFGEKAEFFENLGEAIGFLINAAGLGVKGRNTVEKVTKESIAKNLANLEIGKVVNFSGVRVERGERDRFWLELPYNFWELNSLDEATELITQYLLE